MTSTLTSAGAGVSARAASADTRHLRPHNGNEALATADNSTKAEDALNVDHDENGSYLQAETEAPHFLSSPTSTSLTTHPRKPSGAGLHLHTHVSTPTRSTPTPAEGAILAIAQSSDTRLTRPAPLHATRSYDNTTNPFHSPASSVSSPALAAALSDVTPLPSPLNLSNSPDLWKRIAGRPHSGSSTSLASQAREEMGGYLSTTSTQISPLRKKKLYPSLGSSGGSISQEGQERSRAVSEFVPDPLFNIRPRYVTVSGSPASEGQDEFAPPLDQHMQREEHFAKQRGLLDPSVSDAPKITQTPLRNNRSVSDVSEEECEAGQEEHAKILVVRDVKSKEVIKWRQLRLLGQGAFSEVVLAVKEDRKNDQNPVAIKIVSHHHHTNENSDEERMETSIKREIEILQSISHPCLPRLIAFNDDEEKALLVLNYCSGGDLFEFASQQRDQITPPLIQRIFAELVAAVAYLHGILIVHRDIKLENILLNIPASHLSTVADPLYTYPYPLITLTDLGLSKRIPSPPALPLLTHPCGSTDYAAPELLLGQSYDGRLVDAWALGVVLYALMEGRLPFDPLPVSNDMSAAERQRRKRGHGSSVKHRIARCDWLWCEFGDDYGDWEESKGKGFEDARKVVEGLLKKAGRGRWGVERVMEVEWVKGGIDVSGGLRVLA